MSRQMLVCRVVSVLVPVQP